MGKFLQPILSQTCFGKTASNQKRAHFVQGQGAMSQAYWMSGKAGQRGHLYKMRLLWRVFSCVRRPNTGYFLYQFSAAAAGFFHSRPASSPMTKPRRTVVTKDSRITATNAMPRLNLPRVNAAMTRTVVSHIARIPAQTAAGSQGRFSPGTAKAAAVPPRQKKQGAGRPFRRIPRSAK